jgi:hypothetical protein
MRSIYLICTLAFCIIQCNDPPESGKVTVTEVTSFFQGEHDLYPLSDDPNIVIYINGIMGNSEGNAQFIWKNNSDQYIMTSLPLNKIRLQIKDNDFRSYCKFRWTSSKTWDESKWDLNVLYVICVLRSNQIKIKDN